jgi:hypothetical protein
MRLPPGVTSTAAGILPAGEPAHARAGDGGQRGAASPAADGGRRRLRARRDHVDIDPERTGIADDLGYARAASGRPGWR